MSIAGTTVLVCGGGGVFRLLYPSFLLHTKRWTYCERHLLKLGLRRLTWNLVSFYLRNYLARLESLCLCGYMQMQHLLVYTDFKERIPGRFLIVILLLTIFSVCCIDSNKYINKGNANQQPNLTNAQDEIIVEYFKRKMTGSDLRENLIFSHQNDRKDPGFLNPSVDFDITHDKTV